MWNSAVKSSYAFIFVDSKILIVPHSVWILDHSALVEGNVFYHGLPMDKNYFSKIYIAHSSQEFCITWMLPLYFHILNCYLFKQITITYVHAVCLDNFFKADVLSQYTMWKTALGHIWNSLQLSEPVQSFSVKCCSVTAWRHNLWALHILPKWF